MFVSLHHTVEGFKEAERTASPSQCWSAIGSRRRGESETNTGDTTKRRGSRPSSTSKTSKKLLLMGHLRRRGLDQVVNVVEERAELAKTPNAAKHFGIHLDASFTIQTRRRFHSVLPATTEALRLKFSVMSNLWLLPKMRQPARQIFADFTETTFPKILDELLSEKNFVLDP